MNLMLNFIILSRMILALIALVVCLGQSQTYDAYSFKKARTFIDNFGNMYTTGIGRLTFNDDQTYMAMVGSFNRDPLEIYYRTSTNYSFAYTLQPPDGTGLSIITILLFGTNPSVYAFITYSDNQMRSYKINQTSALYLQTISYSNSAYLIGRSINYLILSTSTNATVLEWNSGTSRMNTIFSTSGTSGSMSCRAISQDGAYYIQERYANTSFIDLYTLSGGNYSVTDSYDLSPWTLVQVRIISIYQDPSGNYYAAITRNSGTSFDCIYLLITSNTLSLYSTPPPINIIFTSYVISVDGSSILGYRTNNIYYYSYDNTSNTYTQLYYSSAYPSTPGSLAIYTNDAGTFFAFGVSSMSRSGYEESLGFIQYVCNVVGCTSCSMPGVCAPTTTTTTTTTTTNTSSSTPSVSTSQNSSTLNDSTVSALMIAMIVLVCVLLIAMVIGFSFLFLQIKNLKSKIGTENQPPKNTNEVDKAQNKLNDTQMNMGKHHSDANIADEMFDDIVEETKNVRRRKPRKDNFNVTNYA